MKMGQYIDNKNITLWIERRPAPGPTCLLVGGAGAIAAFWPDSFCDALHRAGFQVIRYDHRDTGLSTFVDFDRDPYGLMDLLDDALTILDHVGVQSAHWVGHSMGGFVAQLAAIHHPERVLSLTSMSSHAAHPDLPSPSAETWKVMLANQPRGDIRRDLPGFMTVWRYLNGSVPFDEGAAAAYTRELYRRNPKTLPATNHVAIQADMADRTPDLERLDLPALIVHGEADPLVPMVGGTLTAEAIPNARFLSLPDVGHMFFNGKIWETLAKHIIETMRHRRALPAMGAQKAKDDHEA